MFGFFKSKKAAENAAETSTSMEKDMGKMNDFYEITIAGCKRQLKKFAVNDKIDIAAFILFGDVEITEKSAEALLDEKRADVERKVEAAKAALKDAAGKLQNAAADATDDLKDVVSAGLKSLAAGWEEAKKTFNQFRGDK